jgi:hypothetical protein
MMRKVLFAFVAAMVCATAHGDELAERRQLASELLVALNMEATVGQTADMLKTFLPAQSAQMGKQMGKMLPGAGATEEMPDADKMHRELMEKMMALVFEEMSWQKMKDDYVTLYAETFSAEELRALVAFYRTPAGAYVEKQPELMLKTMNLSQKAMERLMPKMVALQDALVKDAQAQREPEKRE